MRIRKTKKKKSVNYAKRGECTAMLREKNDGEDGLLW
jgi:hypothetical protein